MGIIKFRKKNKYNNKQCWVLKRTLFEVPPDKTTANLLKEEMVKNGALYFDSKKEGNRYIELKYLLDGKEISALEVQPVFPLLVNGQKLGKRGRFYRADFKYKDKDGNEIVEDVKGKKTREYTLKRDLFLALYPNLKFIET